MTQGQINMVIGLLGLVVIALFEIKEELSLKKENRSRLQEILEPFGSFCHALFGVCSALWFIFGIAQYLNGR